MSRVSNSLSQVKSLLLLILVVSAIIKILWVSVELLWLPASGVDYIKRGHISYLNSSYQLASNTPVVFKKKKRTPKRVSYIKGMKLEAVYKGPKALVAVIKRGSKSYVLRVGETILGYRLVEVDSLGATLVRGSREYRLNMPNIKSSQGASQNSNFDKQIPKKSSLEDEIINDDNRVIVPRKIIQEYSSDMNKIWKNIAINPLKRGGKLTGFIVNYVRPNSVFYKMGLRNGDIIKKINGETIEDYSIVMDTFKEAKDLSSLILDIKRGGKSLELDYEIR